MTNACHRLAAASALVVLAVAVSVGCARDPALIGAPRSVPTMVPLPAAPAPPTPAPAAPPPSASSDGERRPAVPPAPAPAPPPTAATPPEPATPTAPAPGPPPGPPDEREARVGLELVERRALREDRVVAERRRKEAEARVERAAKLAAQAPRPRPRESAPTKPKGQPTALAAIVNEELAKLPMGRILYVVPDMMKVGVVERVVARIEQQLSDEFFKGLERRGVEKVEEIKVGTFMAVRLTGPKEAFTVERTSSEEQVVAERGVTQWTWDVTPLAAGTHPLTMTAVVRIKIPGGGEERKDYEVFHKAIRVRVDPLGIARFLLRFLFVDQWQWTMTALLGSGGLVWWVLARLRRRR